jgi:arylsulfatase A-like enzyme
VSAVDGGLDVTTADIQNMVDRYDGEIRYVDAEIGRFVEYLRTVGVLDQTTLVIVADHGEAFLEHNRVRHGRELYGTQIHVPLVLWRGRDPFGGRRVSTPVELIDAFPTLFGLLGIGAPAGLQGRDLLSPNGAAADATFSMTWNGREILTGREVELHAIEENNVKYIRTEDRQSGDLIRDELYDLGSDPGEMRDVKAKSPEALERLRKKLGQWRTATDAPAPAALGAPLTEPQKERLRALGYVE